MVILMLFIGQTVGGLALFLKHCKGRDRDHGRGTCQHHWLQELKVESFDLAGMNSTNLDDVDVVLENQSAWRASDAPASFENAVL